MVCLEHNPGHSAPLAWVRFEEKGRQPILAAEGMAIGDLITISDKGRIRPGNVMRVGQIPEGTSIHNIELKPGDGGKLAKGAGTSGQILSHGDTTQIQLPSGLVKSIQHNCRASIGYVGGSGRPDKPFAKAGTKVRALRSKARRAFTVSGVAKNPVNHPHGGGSHPHVGTQSSVAHGAPPGRKVGNLAPKKNSHRSLDRKRRGGKKR